MFRISVLVNTGKAINLIFIIIIRQIEANNKICFICVPEFEAFILKQISRSVMSMILTVR